MLNSPRKSDPAVEAVVPRSFLRKRIGSLAIESMNWDTEENVDLKGSLGYEVLKRPASKKSKAETATDALPKEKSLVKDQPRDHDDVGRKPWLQLKTTVAKNLPGLTFVAAMTKRTR
jgi:hypothetical protein